MHLRFIILSVSILFFNLYSTSQVVMKVKHKGVQPINVTKPASNAPSFSLNQFNGKWQEISRKDRVNNTSIDFTDTLFFIFSGDNDVYVRDGVSLSLKGKSEILPGNILSTGADEYAIKSLEKTKALLDDGINYIHTIVKKKNFTYEAFPTDTIIQKKYTTPINISFPDIEGVWNVYKREATPGNTSADEPLIKTFSVNAQTDSTINGQITFYQADKSQTLPCTVTIDGTKIQIVTSSNLWLLNVYKADKNELVFGSTQLMYYCTPGKK